MAFPPRPPLIPGVPVPGMVTSPFAITANMVPAIRVPHMRPPLESIPTPVGIHAPPRRIFPPRPMFQSSILGRPPSYSQRIEASGPAVTVFVGNITEKAPDIMIRHILNSCGPVLNWKRVQGASGKLQGFGFCEFGSPDAALRAIRILHDYEIAGSKLVVKADSKTNEILDDFKEKTRKAHLEAEGGEGSPLQDEKKQDDDEAESYMNEDMRAEDEICGHRVAQIVLEYRKDIANYISQPTKQDTKDRRMNKAQEKLSSLSTTLDIPTTLRLEDMTDVEEGKKEIISQEIMQFRETMKKQEEEREKERKLREKLRERDMEIRRQQDLERARERERRRRSRSRSSSRSPSVDSKHSRRSRRRSHSKSRSPVKRTDRDSYKEREKIEEEKEKKEQERKIRKKELQYQERLKNWESREQKKQKELTRESEREKHKEADREKDAKKIKEFLEDYDDDRDDPKYYKGHSFQKKQMSREHEIELDNKDRVKEKEELEELRSKIMAEGHDNPEAAYEEAVQEREKQYEPKLVLKPVQKPPSPPPSVPSPVPQPPSPKEPLITSPEQAKGKQNGAAFLEDSLSNHSNSIDHPELPEHPQEDDNSKDGFLSVEIDAPQQPPAKKKKFDIKDVFNQDDDDDSLTKKKKLPLPVNSIKDKMKEKGGEEKRKHIKSLIDKIPTSKAELFAYPIDASLVDSTLMEKRIRPWINKKIIEYIGEPEPTLVDFICSKVLEGSQPQSLLNDVQMVLDDEADVFVVKMWRLLIYEIEAKKIGLAKT